MSDRKSMDDWQLSESSESGDQWQLLDQEQDLPESLQLQDSPDSQYHQWQPVEYEDEQKTSGSSWILPTLIIVALLAVLGYIGWLAMNGFDFSGIALQQPAATESVAQTEGEPAVAAVPTVVPAEEAAPTATPLPATPTLAPTPTLEPTPFMVEQRIATIDSQYGLNARLEPNADSEVTKILDDGTAGVIVDEVPGWVKIELDDGEQLWVSSDFVVISSELVPGDPVDAPTPQPDPGIAADGAVVVVIAEAGVNARSVPNTDGDILQVLSNEASFTVVDVADDGEWVQIELDDGTTAWVTTNEEFVTVNGDLPSPTPPQAAPGEEVPATEAAATPAAEEPVADPTAVPDVAVEDALVIVDNLVGVLSRVGPSSAAEAADRLPGGTEAPAVGRNAEGDWIQVELENGSTVWVFAGSVSLNLDVDALPVIEP